MQAQVFADAVSALDHSTPVTMADRKAARAADKAKRVAKQVANADSRKANGSDYGVGGRWVTVTVLAPSRRGANARGTSASLRGWGGSQPKGAKRAKRQMRASIGGRPLLRSSL